MISATLLALVMHVQVLPALDKQYDLQPGVIVYAEVPPSTRLSIQATRSDLKGWAVRLNARWQF